MRWILRSCLGLESRQITTRISIRWKCSPRFLQDCPWLKAMVASSTYLGEAKWPIKLKCRSSWTVINPWHRELVACSSYITFSTMLTYPWWQKWTKLLRGLMANPKTEEVIRAIIPISTGIISSIWEIPMGAAISQSSTFSLGVRQMIHRNLDFKAFANLITNR